MLSHLALLLVPVLEPADAVRFAGLALDCVHSEYPNKIAHAMNSDADARPPRELTPAFYGCYDWHSSVHGHWLLARVARGLVQLAQQQVVSKIHAVASSRDAINAGSSAGFLMVKRGASDASAGILGRRGAQSIQTLINPSAFAPLISRLRLFPTMTTRV